MKVLYGANKAIATYTLLTTCPPARRAGGETTCCGRDAVAGLALSGTKFRTNGCSACWTNGGTPWFLNISQQHFWRPHWWPVWHRLKRQPPKRTLPMTALERSGV